jgi:hypothetical protein
MEWKPNMTKIFITEDGERIEATGEVLEYILNNQAEAQAMKDAKALAEAVKAEAKAALLEKLGITADEAALLLA